MAVIHWCSKVFRHMVCSSRPFRFAQQCTWRSSDFLTGWHSKERSDALDETQGEDSASNKPFVVCVISDETFVRLRTPARGIRCTHSTCFDLEFFLQRTFRQKEKNRLSKNVWECPLCENSAPPHELYVCKYTENIVRMCETGVLPCDAKKVMDEGGKYTVVERVDFGGLL